MSLPFKYLYEFGEFRLDLREKILTRGGETVELTPKAFELLTVFVENHGLLLKKDELMDKIWADSFVEESNLTFNIRQLRKILGDDAHNPTYIKTVRRHGYRFIADVKQISAEKSFTTAEPEDNPAPVVSISPEISTSDQSAVLPKTRSFPGPVFLVAAVLLGAALAAGLWYVRSGNYEPAAPVLAAPFSAEKLSTNGKVSLAVITPDGKNVIYTSGAISEKQSIRLRQLENGSSVEIIPPSEAPYYGLALSPDGKILYFARRPRQPGETMGIYRVSIFGGIPQKIVTISEGWISISPDGAKISFVRCPYGEEEYCSLWVADAADGANEKKLITRPRPFRIGENRFSPDGQRIAFAVGQSANASNEFGLAEVDLKSGAESEISAERFFNIRYMAWLPGGKDLLITASRTPTKTFRIWQIGAASGKAEPLTKDSESYSVLSLDKDADQIVSTQVKQDFRVRLLNAESPSNGKNLTDGSSVSYAPDGKIYFTSIMSGNDEIWSIDADGSGQSQLTNNEADESLPVVSADNSLVFFTSNKTGTAQVWRMNPDGSNQTQITEKEGGAPFFVSPDGEWVYYRSSLSSKLWRVSAKGGGEHIVIDKAKNFFSFSPDGSQVAFFERQNGERILTIVSLADGQTVKTFGQSDPSALLITADWTPDGKNLLYISADREFDNKNLWLQPLDGGAPKQIADLGSDEVSEFGLSISPDGKTFAVVQGRWLHDAVLIKGLR